DGLCRICGTNRKSGHFTSKGHRFDKPVVLVLVNRGRLYRSSFEVVVKAFNRSFFAFVTRVDGARAPDGLGRICGTNRKSGHFTSKGHLFDKPVILVLVNRGRLYRSSFEVVVKAFNRSF